MSKSERLLQARALSRLSESEALAVMPPILSGETIRSYIARASLLTGHVQSVAFKQIFGNRHKRHDWTLPVGINEFAAAVGVHLGATEPLYWLDQHTLAPFWTSTMRVQGRQSYEERLLSDSPGPRRPLISIGASDWFTAAPRICPACDAKNVRELGFSIVDRRWLIPFSTRCWQHGERLIECPDWSPAGMGRGRDAKLHPRRVVVGSQISRACAELLEGGSLLGLLGALLRSRGYVTGGGRIRRQQLCALLMRFSRGRFEHPDLDRLMSTQASVVRLLNPLWSQRGSVHPVIATQLIAALKEEHEIQTQLDFCAGVKEELRTVVASAVQDAATATEAARKAGVSVTTACIAAAAAGKSFKVRPKLLKPELRTRIEVSLSAGEPMGAIAHMSGVSLSSVYRVLAASTTIQMARRLKLGQQAAQNARSSWMALISEHPHAGATALRSLRPALYAGLYRKDRDWLRANSPTVQRAESSRNARQPLGAEQEMAQRVLDAFGRTGPDATGPRATATSIKRAAGLDRKFWGQALPPLAVEALRLTHEPLRAFVYRRLSQAAADVRNSGHAVVTWRVVRQSGLRESTVRTSGVCVVQVIRDTRAAALRGDRYAA